MNFLHPRQFPLWVVLVTCLMTGCSSLLEIEDNLITNQLSGSIPQWDVQGKLAIYTDTDSHSTLLTWRQRPNSFDLLLSSPFAGNKLHIVGGDGWITATDAHGQIRDTSPARLFEQYFGWSFPLEHLTYWVTGVPAPDSHAIVDYDQQGRVMHIEQAGWQVHYQQYRLIGQLLLPYKMTIRGPHMRLVLVLKDWTNLAL